MVTLVNFTVRSAYKDFTITGFSACVEVARALIKTSLKPSFGGDSGGDWSGCQGLISISFISCQNDSIQLHSAFLEL
jgi:hypothetical protein